MKYQVIEMIDGKLCTYTTTDIYAAMEYRKAEFMGASENRLNRDELWGQPVFAGFIGPSWAGLEHGRPIVKYESFQAYNSLPR